MGNLYKMADRERPAIGLDWCPSKSLLAILQDKSNLLLLWDAEKRVSSKMDMTLKNPTVLSWSLDGQYVLVFYFS
jgi:hypothetical protein